MKFYTVDEVAELMHCSSRTISELAKVGEIKGKKVGKRWIFTPLALENFLNDDENMQRGSALNDKEYIKCPSIDATTSTIAILKRPTADALTARCTQLKKGKPKKHMTK